MNKTYRQAKILEVIRAKRVTTQDDLARELLHLGIQTTQVTLSRDLREIGLAKTASGYQELTAPVERPRPDVAALAGEFLTGVRAAMNQVVIRTTPGSASTLAAALDAQDWPEVVGTLAGDDTILIVAPDPETAERLRQKLLELVS
jgi:transcriptional regulator of arginine metabolism